MNKFLALTLVALVASVSAAPADYDDNVLSQAIASSDDTETGLLLGHENLFQDFCRSQADRVAYDMSTASREAGAAVMNMFFGKINEITDEVVNVQKDVVAQLSQSISKPNEVAVNDGQISESQIQQLIQEGKEAIKAKDGVAGIVPATKTAISAMLSTINSATFTRLAKARAQITGAYFYNGFKSACEKVASYENEMAAALEEYKSQIAQESIEPEAKKFVEGTTITSLNCFTTKNIVRLNGFCEVVQAGHAHFFKMLGMKDPIAAVEQSA